MLLTKVCVLNSNSKPVVVKKIGKQTKCEQCLLTSFYSVFVLVNLLTLVEARGISRVARSSGAQNSPYIIDSRVDSRSFNVYWNVPTVQCQQYGINFDEISKTYGLKQNKGDTFRGDSISILYDPGKFPALLENGTQKELFRRNGGVPQEGSLQEHLNTFSKHIEELIPDGAFSGLGIIDFESWRPVFRQNFGKLTPYKDTSYQIERERHYLWPKKWIEKEATRRFEESGRPYMEQTLAMAREARPLARWGYYAFPYCFNMGGGKNQPNCPDEVVKENNDIQWLWDGSDILLPSVYMSKKSMDAQGRLKMVKGRVAEAMRLSKKSKLSPTIYPYVWYKYQDDTDVFLTKEDLYNSLNHMSKSGLAGAIIWGSSNDVSSKKRCLLLKEYIENVLGPTVKQFVSIGSRKSVAVFTRDDESLQSTNVNTSEEIELTTVGIILDEPQTTLSRTTPSETIYTSGPQKRSTHPEFMTNENESTLSQTTSSGVVSEKSRIGSTNGNLKTTQYTPITSPGTVPNTSPILETSTTKTTPIKLTTSPMSNSVVLSEEYNSVDLTTVKTPYISTSSPLSTLGFVSTLNDQTTEKFVTQNNHLPDTKTTEVSPEKLSDFSTTNIDTTTDSNDVQSNIIVLLTKLPEQHDVILDETNKLYPELQLRDPTTEVHDSFPTTTIITTLPSLKKTEYSETIYSDPTDLTRESGTNEGTSSILSETTNFDTEFQMSTTESDSITVNSSVFVSIEPVSKIVLNDSEEVLVNEDLINSIVKSIDNTTEKNMTATIESNPDDSISMWEKIRNFFVNAFQ